jgi:hypothetical protein
MYLSRGTGEFAPDFVEPSARGTGEYGMPPPRTSPIPAARGTGEFGQPGRKTTPQAVRNRGTGGFSPRGTGERNVADVREEVAPRAGRDARRDDAGGMAARVARAMAADEAESREPSREFRTPGTRGRDQPTQPLTPTEHGAWQPGKRKRNLAEIDDPFISSTPRRAPEQAQPAGGQARRVPSLAAPPLSGDMPSSPFQTSRPPSQPREDETPIVPLTAQAAASTRRRDETIPLEDISSAHAARESAERASSGRPEEPRVASLPVEAFDRVDASPFERALAVARVQPAAAAAGSFDPLPTAEPAAQAAAPAAPARAITQPMKELEPARVEPARAQPKPQSVAPEPPPSEEITASAVAPVPAELDESVLSALADELRRFPEVEWACELPGGDETTISIRVDPSYLQRIEDIEDAVRMMARRSGAEVKPMIVSTPAATKDARARGRMFFPWKKKK